jgi:trans-aconitate methyltransferase
VSTETRLPASDFDGQTCSAPEARTRRMAEIVLDHVDAATPIRMLDLGCGTGMLAFRLADALPSARITGLDISRANIDAANAALPRTRYRHRIDFVHADYLEHRHDPFDVIVTDGVLHLVPVEDARLIGKLAADTRPGGQLIVCMPYQCAYNTAFTVVRQAMRATRNPLSDRAIVGIGRLLHPEASTEMLLERVHYIYRPPERVMGASLAQVFDAAGLTREAAYPMPSSSLAQLRHSVTVWRKRP